MTHWDDTLEDAWLAHLGASRARFPREVAFPLEEGRFSRVQVSSPTEYVELVRSQAPSTNVYTSVLTASQSRDGVWDKIFLDIDAEDFFDSCQYKDAVCSVLLSRYGGMPSRTYVSGSKGFAVYLDLPEATLDRRAVRQWCVQLEHDAGVPLDHTSMGDRRRVSRIPYTYNFNALKSHGRIGYCIPVDPHWSPREVAAEAKDPKQLLPVTHSLFPEIVEEIRAIERDLPERRPLEPLDPTRCEGTLSTLLEIAPRVGDAREKVVTFIIVPTMVGLGRPVEECRDFVMQWLQATARPFNRPWYERHVEVRYYKVRCEGYPPWSFETLKSRFPSVISR